MNLEVVFFFKIIYYFCGPFRLERRVYLNGRRRLGIVGKTYLKKHNTTQTQDICRVLKHRGRGVKDKFPDYYEP